MNSVKVLTVCLVIFTFFQFTHQIFLPYIFKRNFPRKSQKGGLSRSEGGGNRRYTEICLTHVKSYNPFAPSLICA